MNKSAKMSKSSTKKKKAVVEVENNERRPYVSPSQNMLRQVPYAKPIQHVHNGIIEFSESKKCEVANRFKNLMTLLKDLINVYNTIVDSFKDYSRCIAGQARILLDFQSELNEFSTVSKTLKNAMKVALDKEREYRKALHDIDLICTRLNNIAEHTDVSITNLASDIHESADAMSINYSMLVDVIQVTMNTDFEGRRLDDGYVLLKIKESYLNSLAALNPTLRQLDVYGGD